MYESDFPRRCDGPMGILMKKHPLCTFLAGLVLGPTLLLLLVSLLSTAMAFPFALALGWL